MLTTQEEVQIICSGACPEYDCAASYSNGGSPHQHAEQPHEGEGEHKLDLFLEVIGDREQWIKARMVLSVDHNGERIWSCTECDFSHKKTTNVSDHIEVNHLVIRVPCHLCPLTFSTSSYLKKHFKHKHPGALM